jgi:hypothetical protein
MKPPVQIDADVFREWLLMYFDAMRAWKANDALTQEIGVHFQPITIQNDPIQTGSPRVASQLTEP